MKKIIADIECNCGYTCIGRSKGDEEGTNIEISDELAAYLQPILDEESIDIEDISDLEAGSYETRKGESVEKPNDELKKELDKLYYRLSGESKRLAVENALKDAKYLGGDAIHENMPEYLKSGQFVPSVSFEQFCEPHKDEYDEPEYYNDWVECEAEEEYCDVIFDEFWDWATANLSCYERSGICGLDDCEAFDSADPRCVITGIE